MQNILEEKKPNASAQLVIDELLEGRETALKQLYPQYLGEFLNWAKKRTNFDDSTLQDAYQDGLIIFYEKVINYKIESLTCSVKTYIFAVAWNKIKQHNRDRSALSKIKSMPYPSDFEKIAIELEEEYFITEEKEDQLHKAFLSLTPSCQKVLNLFFFQNLSAKEVATQMGYANAEVARVIKFRCLATLKGFL